MFVPHFNPAALIARVAVVALFTAVIGGPAVAGHVPGAAPMAPGHNAVLVLPPWHRGITRFWSCRS